MRDDQHDLFGCEADRLLAIFAVNDSILMHECERIVKHQGGDFETHAVFKLIGSILCLVPFKLNHVLCYYNYVNTASPLFQNRPFAQMRQ